MTYFYDYYAKEYRELHKDRLLSDPAALFQNIDREKVQRCRRVLRNVFSGYRDGRNRELVKRLLNEYREYVSGSGDEDSRNRFNAFVYRYMIDVPVGMRAIGNRLGVAKDTAALYVSRVTDEMLLLCMGIPAAVDAPEDREGFLRMLIEKQRIFQSMAGDYVISMFPGQQERNAIEQSRELTAEILQWLTESARAYSDYCNDTDTHIDTDIRKAEILEKRMQGISVSDIAEEYGCTETTIYSDIRENESRLAAMIFEMDGGVKHGSGKRTR